MSADKRREIVFVFTDAQCVDESLGKLFAAFEEGGLSPEDQKRFLAHAEECPACNADLTNTASLLAALHHLKSLHKTN